MYSDSYSTSQRVINTVFQSVTWKHSILDSQGTISFTPIVQSVVRKQNDKYYKLYTMRIFSTTSNSIIKIKMER